MANEVDKWLRRSRGVIHVGANTGQERDAYAGAGLSVIWVEPIDEVFAELKKNIAGYRNQRAIKALLTDESGQTHTFKIANNGGASSSIFDFAKHKEIWPDVHYTDERPIVSSTLNSLMIQEGITARDFPALVMDVQGAELLVLKGLGQRLRDFSYVRAEAADFESYAGCSTLKDLDDYVSAFGFTEVARCPFATHPSGEGRYWDVTWVKPKPSIVDRIKDALFGA